MHVAGDHQPASSRVGLLRRRFVSPRPRFSVSRRRREALGILVGRRGVTGRNAEARSSKRRARAARRLASCVRNRHETTKSSSLRLILVRSCEYTKFRSSSFNAHPASRLSRTITRVLSLLTFCPPGPPDREKMYDSASSGTRCFSDSTRRLFGSFTIRAPVGAKVESPGRIRQAVDQRTLAKGSLLVGDDWARPHLWRTRPSKTLEMASQLVGRSRRGCLARRNCRIGGTVAPWLFHV